MSEARGLLRLFRTMATLHIETPTIESSTNMTSTPALGPLAETQPHAHRVVRKVAYGGLLGAIPAGIGVGLATATGSRRGGAFASAAALLGMLALRWQFQRWFTDEPRHIVEGTIGHLELRGYAPRVEARTVIGTESFDDALDLGYERLFRYINGHNQKSLTLAMTAPVTVTRSTQGHVVSFVMPPDHHISSLPRPRDMRVQLVPVPAQRIAALCFRGRHGSDVVNHQEAEMVREVLEGGIDTTGEPVFAAYDPPSTIGLLRRNEIWMEIA